MFDADSFSGYAIARKKKDVKEPGISYVTHVQSYGWQGKEADPTTWKADGKLSGTVGESKRLEAIRIKLNDGKTDIISSKFGGIPRSKQKNCAINRY